MRKSKLITELQEIPGDPNVKIYDHRKLLHYASDGPCDEGLYDFEVSQLNDDLSPDEIEFSKEVYEVDPKPFIVLAFDNEEYDDEGNFTDLRDPKIKAEDLFNKFFAMADPVNDSKFKDNLNRKLNAKSCCFVAIDELISELGSKYGIFWEQVRKHIETMDFK